MQVLGAEPDDRHLVLGQPLGRLVDVDRPDLDAAKDGAVRGKLEGSDRLERRDDLAEVAVIAVVLVADDDDVGGLGHRLVTAAVGRSIRVEDDPDASRVSIRNAAWPYQVIRMGGLVSFGGDGWSDSPRRRALDHNGPTAHLLA